MRTVLVAGLLTTLSALAIVPTVDAAGCEPPVTPVIDYVFACYGYVDDTICPMSGGWIRCVCPVERTLYDEILGGPFTGQPCVTDP